MGKSRNKSKRNKRREPTKRLTPNNRLFVDYVKFNTARYVRDTPAPVDNARPIRRIKHSLHPQSVQKNTVNSLARTVQSSPIVSQAFDRHSQEFASYRKEVCRRRQQRAEVLHAFKKTGRGSSRRRKVIKPESMIRC